MNTKKQTNRALSLTLVITLLLSLFAFMPLTASAYTIGDDYPYKDVNKYGSSAADPWNYYYRQCTSFVAWRLNQVNGIAFHNRYMGINFGNANSWDDAAIAKGITVNNIPAVGAVAQTDAGPYGHVAWVSAVNDDEVTIEEYNYSVKGAYNTRTVKKSAFVYIHFKDLGGAVPPPTPTTNYVNISGEYNVVNVSSGKYLNNFGGDSNGARITASNGDNTIEQNWAISQYDGKKHIIRTLFGSQTRVLDVLCTSAADIKSGSITQMWSQTPLDSKHWYFEPVSGNTYIIRNALNTNLVLAVKTNDHRSDVIVQAYSGSNMQKWNLIDRKPVPITLDKIAITSNPGKTVYTKGEALDLAGVTVTASYSNGSSKTVTGYTASPANGAILNTEGTQAITVSYTEGNIVKTAGVTVTVNPAPVLLDKIVITSNPGKTVYTKGEALDITGLTVTASYSNGSSKAVTGYTTSQVNGAILNKEGTQTITVSYTEGNIVKTAGFSVTVNPLPVLLDKIVITSNPAKTVYTVGESLDLAGLSIIASYSNGTSKAVKGYSSNPANGAILNSEGTQTVTVSYVEGGIVKTADFIVTVKMLCGTGTTSVSVTPSAALKKLNGNQNELTITVIEQYPDMSSKMDTVTIYISNNSSGIYNVGAHKVYVDTKGNSQISACYIVH